MQAESYSKPYQTSKTNPPAKIVNDLHLWEHSRNFPKFEPLKLFNLLK